MKIQTLTLQSILVCLFLALAYSGTVAAQDCTSSDITLNSQEEVDNLQASHGPCDRVLGHLLIEGDNIQNLNGLSALISVGGTVVIQGNTPLSNLDGLSGLTSIGESLRVFQNPNLAHIDGLSALHTIGESLMISGNEELGSIGGLLGLSSVANHLWITFNPLLLDLTGLENIEDVGWELNIIDNDELTNVDGLSSVNSVGWGLHIQSNSSLEQLNGLASLKYSNSILINTNPVLGNVDGLAGLEWVGSIQVRFNYSLANCLGIVKLIDPVDDAEPGPGPGPGGVPDVEGYVTIMNNLRGCNSIQEILASAPLDQVNPGLNDAWYNPMTDGQGFFITVFPELGVVSLAWFTYDTELPPIDATANLGDPGHRWLTAVGPYADNEAVLDIEITQGGVFDSTEPTPEQSPDGIITIDFRTCNTGLITYDIPSISRQGAVPIERVALDNVSLCYLLKNQAEAAALMEGD